MEWFGRYPQFAILGQLRKVRIFLERMVFYGLSDFGWDIFMAYFTGHAKRPTMLNKS